MSSFNKVILVGNLTRDPEPILNGKGAKFGFAVNNRKLNDKQEWEDVPVFIDMEIWNRGEMGKQADRVLQTLRKGQQVFIEGHLKMDQWDDKNGGGKRSKHKIVVESIELLDKAGGGDSGGSYAGGGDEMDAPPARSNTGGSNYGGRGPAPASRGPGPRPSAPPGPPCPSPPRCSRAAPSRPSATAWASTSTSCSGNCRPKSAWRACPWSKSSSTWTS